MVYITVRSNIQVQPMFDLYNKYIRLRIQIKSNVKPVSLTSELVFAEVQLSEGRQLSQLGGDSTCKQTQGWVDQSCGPDQQLLTNSDFRGENMSNQTTVTTWMIGHTKQPKLCTWGRGYRGCVQTGRYEATTVLRGARWSSYCCMLFLGDGGYQQACMLLLKNSANGYRERQPTASGNRTYSSIAHTGDGTLY